MVGIKDENSRGSPWKGPKFRRWEWIGGIPQGIPMVYEDVGCHSAPVEIESNEASTCGIRGRSARQSGEMERRLGTSDIHDSKEPLPETYQVAALRLILVGKVLDHINGKYANEDPKFLTYFQK